MTSSAAKSLKKRTISSELLDYVSRLVTEETGVQLGERQKVMVSSRLSKRMSELGIEDEEEYIHHLQTNPHSEAIALVSLLTTHHTYFFREFAHFDFLQTHGLKVITEAARARGERTIRVLSAACSAGQEVYSLAMFLDYHLPRIAPDMTYEILGTDVDPDSVAFAQNGVYHRKEIKEVPLQYLGTHWARGTSDIADYVKVKPSLKSKCTFKVHNLRNLAADLKDHKFDIVFCRNVFIYFKPEQIQAIAGGLLRHLHTDGLLFIGISESLNGLNLQADMAGPSIYNNKKPDKTQAPAAHQATTLHASTRHATAKVVELHKAKPASLKQKPLRVLCVDDSPSILALLKRILTKESGFEIVDTAENGIEAAEKLKKHEIDIMTLDIHMPKQDGIHYLKQNFGATHPCVVMLSSVSRENAGLAMQCLELGASDYVEKPELSNLQQKAEEIRAKLLSAFRNRAESSKSLLDLDKSFQSKKTDTKLDHTFRIAIGNLPDRKRIFNLLSTFSESLQPPTFALLDNPAMMLPKIAEQLQGFKGLRILFCEKVPAKPENGTVYIGAAENLLPELEALKDKKHASVLLYGNVRASLVNKLSTWKGSQILAEDLGQGADAKTALSKIATDIVPETSFAYMSAQFIGGEK